MSTETELQRQNERFELLLNLTTKITSSLDLREVLRAIAANIREVIHADAVSVSLSDPAPGKARLYAMDFPYRKLLTRSKSLEAPLAELRRRNTGESLHAGLHEGEQDAGQKQNSQSDKSRVADEYDKKQLDQIVQALTACKGRVGGVDGAAAHLGMNRTTLLSRMKKFGIYAKQYA